jgi:hypothetical protein
MPSTRAARRRLRTFAALLSFTTLLLAPAARESLERVAGGSANPRPRAMALGLLKGLEGK